MMGLLTEAALQGYKEYTKRTIDHGRYKVGNTYYQAPVEVDILSDGRIVADILVDHTLSGDITVQEFQLFDIKNQLFCSKAESIFRRDSQEGILYRFAFTITEG